MGVGNLTHSLHPCRNRHFCPKMSGINEKIDQASKFDSRTFALHTSTVKFLPASITLWPDRNSVWYLVMTWETPQHLAKTRKHKWNMNTFNTQVKSSLRSWPKWRDGWWANGRSNEFIAVRSRRKFCLKFRENRRANLQKHELGPLSRSWKKPAYFHKNHCTL
jgi:hypothetical protein